MASQFSPNKAPTDPEQDAPLKEIILYAVGNIEASLANQFYSLMQILMVVALSMNPILLGLIIAIKTAWDGITDPIMAQITDHSRTRWGRRRPYILVGGVGRVLLLIAVFAFFPQDGQIKSNKEYAVEKAAQEAAHSSVEANVPQESQGTDQASSQHTDEKPKPLPSIKKQKPKLLDQIKNGLHALVSSENSYHQKVTLYLLVACILITTFTTINSVPYYALGIELCPSYDGRTRVVTYRAFVDKLMGLLGPWILPFCLLPVFTNVIDGMLWYAILIAVIGIPSTVLMVTYTRERLAKTMDKKNRGPGLFKSIWLTASNIHFLKILFLYQFIGATNGIFIQIGTFLTIYWVFKGDALAGGVLSGYAGTLGMALALMSLPLINWACRKLQKHRALRYGIIWMTIGTALKWFLVSPDHPYTQLLLPFFFSIGISSVYTILPTMMADVTDIDELNTGFRREGMFGAVMAFLGKIISTIQPLLAGVVLVAAGFDASLGADQAPETIFRMRLMFSIIPASLLLLALLALWRYPLTRERMAEVKAMLQERRIRNTEAES